MRKRSAHLSTCLLIATGVTLFACNADELLRPDEDIDLVPAKIEAPEIPIEPDVPVPTESNGAPGSDDSPADLRYQRNSENMLKAEKRLNEILQARAIEGLEGILHFGKIGAWQYEDQIEGLPDDVAKLNGSKVMMVGFMLPIDGMIGMKEFVLVESLWSCCYGTPPDVHQMVRVEIQGKPLDYIDSPIQVVGTFRVKPTIEEDFCLDIYQIEASVVKRVKID